jgi:hypothetical protein
VGEQGDELGLAVHVGLGEDALQELAGGFLCDAERRRYAASSGFSQRRPGKRAKSPSVD